MLSQEEEACDQNHGGQKPLLAAEMAQLTVGAMKMFRKPIDEVIDRLSTLWKCRESIILKH